MNAIRQLPQWCVDIVAHPPRSGEGFHLWLFRAARALWGCGRDEYEITAILENASATCGRRVPASEIQDAVKNSWRAAFQPESLATYPRWPSVDLKKRSAAIHDSGNLADLWALSSPRIEDNYPHTEQIIDRLFPGNPLLCCGKSQTEFDTKPREDWRGDLSRLQFIVPSAMSAVTGKTKDGRESKHTLANTGPRRFLVVEFDSGDIDDHAALLIHLGGYAPLVCAVRSGGKSLHGWFFCAFADEEKILNFFRYACTLGADPITWVRSQFVRMPDGLRDNGKRQTTFFRNFKSLEIAGQ
jgi:hypothetical protein